MTEADEALTSDLLEAWHRGDDRSRDRVASHLYDEVRRVAGRLMRGERATPTFSATDLVGEAYLRLPPQSAGGPADRAEFLAYVVRVMRNVLIDRARRRGRNKRQGRVGSLDALGPGHPDLRAESRVERLLDVKRAFARMRAEYPKETRMLELRFWVGLSNEEIAALCGVSLRSVERAMTFARRWLASELEAGEGAGQAVGA